MAELPDGFDLAALLAPLPGEVPQGTDLREDFSAQSPYFRLRDARSEARDAEKAADRGDEARDPTPLWRTVRDLGMQCLAETSKDLEVAAWTTEALLRLSGLRGLTAGARLIEGLATTYWDGVYPLPDDYGMETRVAPITGLNGRDGPGSLIQPLFKLVLFARPDGAPVALYQWQQSEQLGTLDTARREQRLAAGTVPFDTLEQEARAAGAAVFAALLADATAAREAWQAMAAALDERAGADGPSTTQVRDLLDTLVDLARRYAPGAGGAADTPADTAPGAPGAPPAGAAAAGAGEIAPVAAPGQIASREQALRALVDIARFFRATEPHSPLSYTLEEAARRGRLNWPDLLAEIVEDEGTRNAILTSLGIRPPQPPGDE